MRACAVFFACALLGCGAPVPPLAGELAIEVTAGPTVALGRAFPLTVTRVWPASAEPTPWQDDALAPLVLQLRRTERTQDATRVGETRHYDAYAFTPGALTLPAPRLHAQLPDTSTRTAVAAPLHLKVASALPEPAGPAELPPGPLPPKPPVWPWLLGAAALVGVAWRIRRRPRNDTTPGPVAPPPIARPADAARAAFAELRTNDAPDAVWYTAFADIVRTYAAARYGCGGPHHDSEEFAALLPQPAAPQVGALLARCDRVKFGCATPTRVDRALAVDDGVRLLEEGAPS